MEELKGMLVLGYARVALYAAVLVGANTVLDGVANNHFPGQEERAEMFASAGRSDPLSQDTLVRSSVAGGTLLTGIGLFGLGALRRRP